jgi:long-chain fatty acid transport protein
MNTKYNGDFVGRYYGLKSEIYSANITPIVAFSWLNFLSFGVGPQFQYFSFDFTQAIDFGSLAQQAGIEGALPGEQDGFETLGLGEWGSGWAIGLIAQPCPYIRLGGGYRSHIHYSFCFHPRYKLGDIGADVVAATGLFQEGYFSRLKIQTPDLAWASLNYAHSACWDFMAGFSYRNWEKGIVVRNDNPGQGKTIILSGLHHVCSYMVGAKYQHPSKAYTWRVGVAYDHDALDAEHATPLFFVDHNLLVSCGGEWCLPYGGKVSIAYSHNYMWEARIAQEEVSLTRGTLFGKAKYDSDIITLQVVKAF